MKNLTTLFTLFMFVQLGFAQDFIEGKITGTIHDQNGNPQEFATIMLLTAHDSAFVKGNASDISGSYSFENIPAGKYLIGATQVGFQKAYSATFEVSGLRPQTTIPAISMKEDVKVLQEIVVASTKPFIEQEIDRTIINVENSIVSSGSSAFEVLEKAPGVTIDRQNDQIQLKGKSGVIVMIDGKQTYLSGQDVANLLKSTSSENIEKIEIITNPSSKYDAAGNTGIINIRMKKNKNFGTNGTATLGAGYGKYRKANGNLMLNHRAGKVNAFGNYGYIDNKSFQESTINRVIPFEGTNTYFDQTSFRPNQFNGNKLRGGIDYFITPKSTIGLLVTGFSNVWAQSNGLNESVISDENGNVLLRPSTWVDVKDTRTNLTGNLNYKYSFNEKGQEITFDADYSRYVSESNNALVTTYTGADFSISRPTDQVRNYMPSTIDIFAFKSDYTLPLDNGSKLEMGVKSSQIQSDNNLIFENFLENAWEYDENRSNHFKYNESIHAAYINFATELSKKTKVQMGLRAEQTSSKGNSVTLNQVVKREYLNLFPTLFVSHQLDSSNTLNLSYSRRIDRPNYQDLNPFIFYLDPYTYQVGNPYLQPQFTHSLQLTHIFRNKFNTSLSYSRTTDAIVSEVPGQIAEENITFVTTKNLATQDNANLTFSFPVKVRNWWNLQANLTGNYVKYSSPYLEGQFEQEALSYNMYVNNSFTLGNGFTGEISGWYNSASVYGFFESQPMGAFSLGIQKSMLDKKLTIKANINDPLWINKFRGSTQYQDIDIKILSKWESRVARVTLTYKFGNQNVKGARQRATSTETERNRAGGDK